MLTIDGVLATLSAVSPYSSTSVTSAPLDSRYSVASLCPSRA